MGRGTSTNVLYHKQRSRKASGEPMAWAWVAGHLKFLDARGVGVVNRRADLISDRSIAQASAKGISPEIVAARLACARLRELGDGLPKLWPASDTSFVIQLLEHSSELLEGKPGSVPNTLGDIEGTVVKLELELEKAEDPEQAFTKTARGTKSALQALLCCQASLRTPLDQELCFELAHKSHRWVLDPFTEENQAMTLEYCLRNEVRFIEEALKAKVRPEEQTSQLKP